ncbi:MAG: hypothetical protein ACT4P7_09870 [Gemmatimonadaceae bacterium]
MANTFLRHTLATLAYRASKALRGAPPAFADFRSGETSRTPVQILAHMGDLFDWALAMAHGEWVWRDSPPLPWNREVDRFFAAVRAFDEYLASGAALGHSPQVLFQGPIADALTHTGQLAMLRRMAGSPVCGESYARSLIEVGRVGLEQAAPVRELIEEENRDWKMERRSKLASI